MVYSQEKEIEYLSKASQDIDDLYYEVFRLLQVELEKTGIQMPFLRSTS